MEPKFEKVKQFSIAGCPQYANPKDLCPGTAWRRLSLIKQKCHFSEPKEEYAVEVYPPDFPQNECTFYYMAGIPCQYLSPAMKSHLFIKEIPEAEYAIFQVQDNDTNNIGATFQYAYKEWLPNSEYVATRGYDLERYKHHPEKCIEVMIPITKKHV